MNLERRSCRQIWAMPVLLGLLTAAALTIGLLGDGAADALSWVGLAAPIAVCVWAVWLRGALRARRR
jgi:hypothetical protein